MSKRNRLKRKKQNQPAAPTQAPASAAAAKPSLPWAPLILLGAAFCVALYLGVSSLGDGSVAGCGPSSGCGDVLKSRWSSFFGLPVSFLALPVYLVLMISAVRFGRGKSSPTGAIGALAAGTMVGAAAVWFTVIQAAVIGKFCPWCLTAHAAGLLGALMVAGKIWSGSSSSRGASLPPSSKILATAAGLLGVLGLIGGQLVYQPETYTVLEDPEPELAKEIVDAKAPIKPSPAELKLHGGRFQLKPEELPLLGSTKAKHFMVSLFDYTCHHCRDSHEHLASVVEAYPDDVAIFSLPMPLNADCNPLMQRMGSKTNSAHRFACRYAALSLAVYHLKPELWQEFDHWLFTGKEPPGVFEANQRAAELVGGEEALTKGLNSSWVGDQIRQSVAIYEANMRSRGQGQMPQVMIGRALSVGGINDPKRLFDTVRNQFKLPAASSEE